MAVLAYIQVPGQVPVNFNSSGVVQTYAGKDVLLFYAGGLSALVTALFIMQRNLVAVLHMGREEQQNPPAFYLMISRFLQSLSLSLSLFVLIVIYRTMVMSIESQAHFGINPLILSVGIILLPAIYFLTLAIASRGDASSA